MHLYKCISTIKSGLVQSTYFIKLKALTLFAKSFKSWSKNQIPVLLTPIHQHQQSSSMSSKKKGGGLVSFSKSMFNTSCVTLPFLVHLLLHCDNDQCGLCCHNLPLPRAQRRPCLGHQQCSLVPRTGTFPRHILQVKGRVLQSINSPLWSVYALKDIILLYLCMCPFLGKNDGSG